MFPILPWIIVGATAGVVALRQHWTQFVTETSSALIKHGRHKDISMIQGVLSSANNDFVTTFHDFSSTQASPKPSLYRSIKISTGNHKVRSTTSYEPEFMSGKIGLMPIASSENFVEWTETVNKFNMVDELRVKSIDDFYAIPVKSRFHGKEGSKFNDRFLLPEHRKTRIDLSKNIPDRMKPLLKQIEEEYEVNLNVDVVEVKEWSMPAETPVWVLMRENNLYHIVSPNEEKLQRIVSYWSKDF